MLVQSEWGSQGISLPCLPKGEELSALAAMHASVHVTSWGSPGISLPCLPRGEGEALPCLASVDWLSTLSLAAVTAQTNDAQMRLSSRTCPTMRPSELRA